MPGERYLDQLRPQAKAAGILLAVVMVTGLGIYSTYWLTSLDTQRSELPGGGGPAGPGDAGG